MFAIWCPRHGARILLDVSHITALRNTPDGIEVDWQCHCGAEGTYRPRRPEPSPRDVIADAPPRLTTTDGGGRSRRLRTAAGGFGLIAVGLVLVVLPGPFTLPFVVAGLGVLAPEFAWAERLRFRVTLRRAT